MERPSHFLLYCLLWIPALSFCERPIALLGAETSIQTQAMPDEIVIHDTISLREAASEINSVHSARKLLQITRAPRCPMCNWKYRCVWQGQLYSCNPNDGDEGNEGDEGDEGDEGNEGNEGYSKIASQAIFTEEGEPTTSSNDYEDVTVTEQFDARDGETHAF
jgi:hypothetical protein